MLNKKIAFQKSGAGFTPFRNFQIKNFIGKFIPRFNKSGSLTGFTLIQLLVVIAIIGLLASVVLVSLNSARQKARNAKRVADLSQMQKALELYFDTYNSYPVTSGWRSQCNAWGGYAGNLVIYDTTAGRGIVPQFMSAMPADPAMKSATNNACYLYMSDGVNYKILDHDISPAEGGSFNYQSYPNLIDPARDSGGNSCSVDGTGIWSWAVYTSGACTW